MNRGELGFAWTAGARRSLNRLPEKVATAIIEFVYGSLAAIPERVGKPLKLDLEGLHSARRGDYRVIYVIDRDGHRVDVIAVEHRSDAYRPR
ncbi:type II toxin-antitoxin system mRNA interferase RelE [soil metagenome]